MSQARLNSEWNRTALIATLIANANRDPKKSRAFKLEDFHPYLPKRPDGMRITAENIAMLKVFVRKQ